MNNKNKGIIRLIITSVVIAALTFVALVGITKDHLGSARNIRLGLDLAGGVSITYEAQGDTPSASDMADTIEKLQRRVDSISTEAEVYQEGDTRINVDIPKAEDPEAIFEQLGKPAKVEFKDPNGEIILDGANIISADAVSYTDEYQRMQYAVSLKFDGTGTKKFADATTKFVGQQIGIYYDNGEEPISDPVVNQAITSGECQIEGMESFQAAQNLATYIRIGALPVELKEIRSNIVGAKLGMEALDSSLFAGIIGFIIVFAFMIFMYRIPGLASSIALAIYVLLMLIGLNGLNIALSLPGVAGIILSIGMAVDANVIIFTRIKEEISKGKTTNTAIKLGFEKAMSAIVDGNVTTIIAAIVLYFLGSGTIKGFAQTLALGIILSMITALFVTKFIVRAFFLMGIKDAKYYGQEKERKSFNYVKNFKKFGLVSIAVVVIGIGAMTINGVNGNDILNFGLDFKGGTSSVITMNESTSDELKKELTKEYQAIVGADLNISEVSDNESNKYIVKTQELTQEKRDQVNDMLLNKFGVEQSEVETTSISAVVSGEMKTGALKAILVATVCMLIYIWIRFKDLQFGASAVIALLHDVLAVITIYAVARLSVGNSFIACMLTIVGYSINATIVIFDRIRENRRGISSIDKLEDIVNTSINQTLTRSIYTSLTTFVMVFVLYIFGVENLRAFALPLMVGIVAGAYSSVCITGTLWHALKKKFH